MSQTITTPLATFKLHDKSHLADGATQFTDRLPDPTEVVRFGGMPGCEYAFVAAENFVDATESGWQVMKDMRNLTVTGPKGSTKLMVLVKGEPIEGADPLNGIRQWSFDRTILERTGLTEPYPGYGHVIQPKEAANAVNDSRAQDRREGDGQGRRNVVERNQGQGGSPRP